MQQEEMIVHACYEDALAADVAALKGPYIVGKKLRPDMEQAAARNWVLNCLNPNHEQNFKQSQVRMIVKLARAVGSTHYARFVSIDADMTEPQPIEPETEFAKLQRLYINSVKQQSELMERQEKLVKLMQGRAQV